MGPMKMRAAIDDIAGVETVKVVTLWRQPGSERRHRYPVNDDTDYMTSEINVIGRTADEAQTEVEKFLDRAFPGRAAADSNRAWHRDGGAAAHAARVSAESSACHYRY